MVVNMTEAALVQFVSNFISFTSTICNRTKNKQDTRYLTPELTRPEKYTEIGGLTK